MIRVWKKEDIGIPGFQLFGFCRFSEAPRPLEKHSHEGCFEFIFLLKGEDIYSAGGRRFPLHGGDVFISAPGQVHFSAEARQGVGEYVWFQIDPDARGFLGLTEEFSLPLRNALGNCRTSCRPVPPEVLRQVKELYTSFQSGRSRLILAGETAILLSSLLEVRGDAASGIDAEILRAMEFARSPAGGNPTLHELACAAGLSDSGFKHKFRKQTGFTPNDYLCRLRIERAAEMLRTGEEITRTAMDCGFGSGSYFSVVFRKYMRQSPSEYRARFFQKAVK